MRRRAYEIWEKEGRPEGRALEHWLQAKQELGPSEEDIRRTEGEISSLSETD